MEELAFWQKMNRGRHPEGAGPEGSEYCVFYGPVREPVAEAILILQIKSV
ncbi:MAG: hypothetical protein HFF28_06995 [Oscillospiraceae bacterium]|nr:hypothetical protein [Oscillospiraceae bacterium]